MASLWGCVNSYLDAIMIHFMLFYYNSSINTFIQNEHQTFKYDFLTLMFKKRLLLMHIVFN